MASGRLNLPMIAPGQAQKEMTHNEALALIDLAVQPAVVAVGVEMPPASPAIGDCWILGATPAGDWTGQAGALAGWTAGGWRFVAPREGMTAWSIADAAWVRRQGGAWRIGVIAGRVVEVGGQQVVAARQAMVAAPAGGTTVDAEARAAVAALIDRLQRHGLIAT